MIMNVYGVRDKQVDAFLQPFFSPSDGSAVRSIRTVVMDQNHEFSKNASDYTLFRLAEFDDATGKFNLPPEPVHIIALATLIPPN